MVPAMNRRKFAKEIARLVRTSGMTRVALAEAAGLSESHIRAIEGGTMPSVENADKLLKAFGLKLTIGDAYGPELEL